MANSVPTHRITAIFPYLAIATTTVLHGFELTSVLPEGGAGQPEHVAPILRMFFDGDGKPIDRATFFEADVELHAQAAFAVEIDRLIAARDLPDENDLRPLRFEGSAAAGGSASSAPTPVWVPRYAAPFLPRLRMRRWT